MLPSPPILLITDRAQARGDLASILDAAFGAGLRWASVREKDLPEAEQLALVRRLLPIARTHGARLTLHGTPALAAEAGVDGVHLASGSDAREARALLGPGALVGLSIHSEAEVRAAPPEANYLIAAPAFATASKPGYGPALGHDGLARFARSTLLPVLALGGIDAEAMRICHKSGVSGVAVMGGVMRAADPAAEARGLLAAWG
ncbi:thiamine phosphate synthase [Azorhizobium oxalatiphilum]|nr:thiamine phosphate synthase [Azorhizobium oxalatiphilum]